MPFLAALAIGLVLTPAARRLGHATGLVDRPGHPLKIHARPVPVLGGLAVVAATLVALAIAGDLPPVAVVAAAALALAGGTVDDLRPLRPAGQLLLQAVAAGILVAGFEPGVLGALGLLVLVLACTNAVNVVDGQDALAGGLAAIAATGLALALAGPSPERAAIGFALAGALCAFLAWNRPPARVFLGNGGAYAVGALLAALAAMVVEEDGARGLATALLCLGVFLFDLAFTVVRRLGSAALATGDRLHSYDLLSAAAGGRGRSTLAFWAAGALAVALALGADATGGAGAVASLAAALTLAGACGHLLWSRRAQPLPPRG
jgi:UDP-GlcNAc:undecaprenyl-phosphate GlcNAc-1-phosphate transferase